MSAVCSKKYTVLVLLAFVGLVLGSGVAAGSPAKVYSFDNADAFSIGGLKAGMSREQVTRTLGAPDKTVGGSFYYNVDKTGVSIVSFRDDRVLQIFGNRVEFKSKPAKNKEQMQQLLGGPPSLQPDDKSSYWYIATPKAKLIIVFSAENGKPYCSLIDRTGKDF